MKRAVAPLICLALSGLLNASDLFTNSTFETGNLSGWSLITSPSTGTPTDNDAFAANDTDQDQDNGELPTAGPFQGSWYSLSDTSGNRSPESAGLYQTVTIPIGTTSVILSAEIFVNDWCEFLSGGALTSCGSGGEIGIWATGANPDTATPLHVLYTADTTTGTSGTPNPYVAVNDNITADVTPGTSYVIGVVESDTEGVINVGIDNFAVTASSGIAPEPAMLLPTLAGLGTLIYRARRRARA
jgi:hypothetical protein